MIPVRPYKSRIGLSPLVRNMAFSRGVPPSPTLLLFSALICSLQTMAGSRPVFGGPRKSDSTVSGGRVQFIKQGRSLPRSNLKGLRGSSIHGWPASPIENRLMRPRQRPSEFDSKILHTGQIPHFIALYGYCMEKRDRLSVWPGQTCLKKQNRNGFFNGFYEIAVNSL
jgi:hypothetical protein